MIRCPHCGGGFSPSQCLSSRQKAVLDRFAALAANEPLIKYAYLKIAPDGDAMVYVLVPELTTSACSRVAGLALQATQNDQTAPIVFDLMAIETGRPDQLYHLNMEGDLIYSGYSAPTVLRRSPRSRSNPTQVNLQAQA